MDESSIAKVKLIDNPLKRSRCLGKLGYYSRARAKIIADSVVCA